MGSPLANVLLIIYCTQGKVGTSAVLIDDLHAWWLSIPLHTPYFTARAPSGRAAFDVLLIHMTTSNGTSGWGEACPVDGGYSPETPQTAWEAICRIAPLLRRASSGDAAERLALEKSKFPFVASAFSEALAAAEHDAVLAPLEHGTAIQLAGTVNSLDTNQAPRLAAELVEQGYTTLKVKVGLDPASDAVRVREIVSAVGSAARLRVDANRGYSEADALQFGSNVPEQAIEVFEQPLAADNWAGLERLARNVPLPLMLDESIYGPADIRRCAGWARAVKLKMSKAGGPRALIHQIDVARKCGLDVVIGNGIASDLGCYHEALCGVRAGLTNAGEFNGFMKLSHRLLPIHWQVANGALYLPAGMSSAPTPSSFAHLTVAAFG